jgi:hypothetical protein
MGQRYGADEQNADVPVDRTSAAPLENGVAECDSQDADANQATHEME